MRGQGPDGVETPHLHSSASPGIAQAFRAEAVGKAAISCIVGLLYSNSVYLLIHHTGTVSDVRAVACKKGGGRAGVLVLRSPNLLALAGMLREFCCA